MARPKEFEPQEALEKAMHQFWAKGYHDTSIRDLVERTGVNYYGLYSEFESKHGLFLAALDWYRNTVTAEIISELKREGPTQQVVSQMFERLLDLMKTADGPVGCLMCNTAVEVAPYDSEAAGKVQAHMKLLRDAFRGRLTKGQQAGSLDKNKNIDALSEYLTTTVYSIGFLTRAGHDNRYIRRHIRTTLTALD